MEPKIEKILTKNQNGFRRNRSTLQILTIHRILEGLRANLEAALLSTSPRHLTPYTGKMEQTLFGYAALIITIAAIVMLYKNTKVKVRSPGGDTGYFNILAGVLQGDTLAPYLLIICLYSVLRTSIELMKENKQKIPGKNYYECRQHRWQSVSSKFTRPSRISAT